MQGISKKRVALATLVVIGAAMSGCSKKDNYAADTAAAVDTTAAMTASSTAPAVQDTATAATTATKPAKTSTAKKAPKKSTY